MSEAVIHVGVHKTGSTTIQRTLDCFRAELERMGIKVYEGSNHQAFYRAFTEVPQSFHRYYRSWNRQADQRGIRNRIKQYFHRWSGYVHLISAEDLSLLSGEGLEQMRDFLLEECGVTRLTVICILRDPIDYVNSSLQQYIKPGLVTLTNLLGNSFPGYRYQGFPGFTGGYEAILQRILFPVPGKLRSVFGSENVEFVNFEIARKAGLTKSVVALTGCSDPPAWIEEKKVNESMSHEACVLLAEYNNRNPLFDDEGRYSSRRNRGNAFIGALRKLEGRAAELVDVALIDQQWLQREVDAVNRMAGEKVLPYVRLSAATGRRPELLEFSDKAVLYIESRSKGGFRSDCRRGRTLTVAQVREINEQLERSLGWKKSMVYFGRRYVLGRRVAAKGS